MKWTLLALTAFCSLGAFADGGSSLPDPQAAISGPIPVLAETAHEIVEKRDEMQKIRATLVCQGLGYDNYSYFDVTDDVDYSVTTLPTLDFQRKGIIPVGQPTVSDCGTTTVGEGWIAYETHPCEEADRIFPRVFSTLQCREKTHSTE